MISKKNKYINSPKGIILALGCRKQVGKDTSANYLISKHGFKRLAFADALKTETHLMLNAVGLDYDEKNKELYRPMLIAYGQLRRALNPAHWLDIVLDTIRKNPNTNWVITDMRYPNEAVALKKLGAIIIKINRKTGLTPEPTETIGDQIEPDFELDNNGSYEDLHKQIEEIYDNRTTTSIHS